jgi:hypothetical protein
MGLLSKRSLEGYLLIDNRGGPGVTPADVPDALLQKQPELVVGKGATFESATVTCCHCGVIVVLNPLRTRPRNWCAKCDAYVCDNPGCHEHVMSMEEMLDTEQDARIRALSQF